MKMIHPPVWLKGGASNPKIANALTSFDKLIRREGIPHITAREFFLEPFETDEEYPGEKIYAFPDPSLCHMSLALLKDVWKPVRLSMGVPMNPRGYRDPIYNRKRKGAKLSQHLWGRAIDFYLAKGHNTPENRIKLCMVGAHLALDLEKSGHGVGFGVYGSKHAPSHIHMDLGYKTRQWNHGKHYLELAKLER